MESNFMEGQGGDIEYITIQNIQSRVVESGNNIRLLCGDGRKIRNIRISGVNCLPESKASSLIVFGIADRYTKKQPEYDEFTDFYVSDIHRHTEDKKTLIWIDSTVGNLKLSNITTGGKWKNAVIVEKDNAIKVLNINDYMFSGEGENGIEVRGIIENLILSSVTVDKVECFLAGDGEIRNGLIKDMVIEGRKFISFPGKISCNFVNVIFKREERND